MYQREVGPIYTSNNIIQYLLRVTDSTIGDLQNSRDNLSQQWAFSHEPTRLRHDTDPISSCVNNNENYLDAFINK